jgi:hypothetical protein
VKNKNKKQKKSPPAGTEVVRETKIGTGAFERNFPEVHRTPTTFSTTAH